MPETWISSPEVWFGVSGVIYVIVLALGRQFSSRFTLSFKVLFAAMILSTLPVLIFQIPQVEQLLSQGVIVQIPVFLSALAIIISVTVSLSYQSTFERFYSDNRVIKVEDCGYDYRQFVDQDFYGDQLNVIEIHSKSSDEKLVIPYNKTGEPVSNSNALGGADFPSFFSTPQERCVLCSELYDETPAAAVSLRKDPFNNISEKSTKEVCTECLLMAANDCNAEIEESKLVAEII